MAQAELFSRPSAEESSVARCNPKEAPDGYIAVLKSAVATQSIGNICRACDWRPECQKPETDFTVSRHRCMSYAVTSHVDGRELKRQDGCSVVFKRQPAAHQPTKEPK